MNQRIKIIITSHMELFSILVSLVLLGVSSLFAWDNNPVMGWDKLIADTCIVIICLILLKISGLHSTSGFHCTGFGKGLLYGLPFLVLGIGSVIISNSGVNFSELRFISVGNSILFTINMILVGMNEEIWMRSLILNGLIQKYGSGKKQLWKSLTVSSLVFGAIHIPNIFFMNPITLMVQVINAAAGGVLFGVIFIKSKNIWAGILVHTLVDWLSLFVGNCFSGGTTVLNVDMSLGQAILMILLGSLPPLILSYLFLRKEEA